MRSWGIRNVLLLALPMSALALVGMSLLQATTPVLVMIIVLTVSGVFRSVGFSAYNSVAFSDVPTEKMTHANTLHATLQELGAGLGIAVGALLVRLGDPISQALGLTESPATAYRVAFVLLALLLMVPLVEDILLPRSAGSAVTGRT